MHSLGRSLILVAILTAPVHAQSPLAPPGVDGNDTGPGLDRPVAVWHFDGAAEPGVPKGAKFEAGPRPPAYPPFPAANMALPFTGKASGITVREKDLPDENLRFVQGESITLEAWVKVKELKTGSYAYLLGKGRSRKPGFPELNQNYALRLKGSTNGALVSFLFSSEPTKEKAADWHRWTTTRGFKVDDAWHHVAVSYTFGKPESVRGYIDGKPLTGEWDMGGSTNRAPVADADDLTLGTGNGGGENNTFHGWLDEVSIWRVAVPDMRLAARYGRGARTPPQPPVVVKKADLVPGKIVVELCEEGMPPQNGWPEQPLAANETYTEDAFGFFEVPQKYIDTGVRTDRGFPFLMRASAEVKLPPGKHRLLLRGRGAARLYIDGKLVLTTPFPPPGSDGHNTMRTADSYLNLGPDFRFAPPGNREVTATFDSTGDEHTVVLETIIGSYTGKARRRPELGETVVAISPQGEASWKLLTPGTRTIPYTDEGWAAYQGEREANLDRMNAAARANLREKCKAYWDRRREAAAKWIASTPTVPVPALPGGFPANNAIDHFLGQAIASAREQAAEAKKGTVDYFTQVKPLLEARCYDCHAGTKVKGGLRLDDHAAALKGGDSDGPAFTPGKPAASSVLSRITSKDDDLRMPPKGEPLTKEQAEFLNTWVREGAIWPRVNADYTTITPLADDLTFLRRATLDTVGVVPTVEEIRTFLADTSKDKRARAIDRLLADPRWADHQMGYWMDVLAENPNILNPTLNNTGPFRWFLYESFRDNKPMDLFVTELLRMKGSTRFGGPAGFAIASQNDSPFANKAAIVASAFLGVEMKCARCHDAPAHVSKQEDLFSVAAMLGTKTLTVPKTSSVPLDKIHAGGRKPLIQVTLQPGAKIEPKWPFSFAPESVADELAEDAKDPRERIAALITAPQDERFAQVVVNRMWKRLMGRGIVEPVDDWERGKPSHPELLKWLGREFVANGYDLKYVARLILNSHAYQRATDTVLKDTNVLFASPAPRRLGAEQIVDSLFTATGKPFRTEEISLDIDGQRSLESSISLGNPRRSWMMTSTSNERDRPSLALPRIQAVTDVLAAFGWRGARQEPTSVREQSPNAMQPAILSNGTMGVWLTRLSDDHGITKIAVKEQSLDSLIDELFMKLLTRKPTAEERAAYTAHLESGFESRILLAPVPIPTWRKPEPYVSWSNHLDPQATIVRQAQELAARRGDPPTDMLHPAWRARCEDVLWALLNSPEFVFTP